MPTVEPKLRAPAVDTAADSRDETPLHFITCGSVDDGKSTLIGRLLWDSKLVLEDQRATLEKESRTQGRAGEGNIDFSLLVDGLSSEREQGITIDVAYRYFQTDKRKFIVADTPGHEQYTRNMASGASHADLAIVLVDVRHGVQTQTRRHMTIVRLLGIRHVVVAVNKMDLVGWQEKPFREIEQTCAALAASLGIEFLSAMPVSALRGDNIFVPSAAMPWYRGPTLMAHLESVNVERATGQAFRFPVQWVNRPGPDFRGYSGTLRGGSVRTGDTVRVWPSRVAAKVERIVTFDGDLATAKAGEAVTLVLDREVDVSRGDMITRDEEAAMTVADQIQASLIWVGTEPLVPGRLHLIQFNSAATTAQITTIKYRLDVDSGAHLGARALNFNEVGVVTLSLDRAMPVDSFAENRHTGSFVLIDRYTNATLAAGMIEFPLRRATNVVWHELAIDKAVRAAQKNQRPLCLWFTGLSGSGKSTVANMVDKRLTVGHRHTYVLDGDNIRHGLNHDLGFTEPDRVENIRRMAEVAKLMVDAGLIVLVCAISPYRRDREMARKLFAGGEFVEVFVDTPLAECETRDPKGLYKKARQGQIPNFTGISAPYERPDNPEIHLEGTRAVEELVDQLLGRLELVPAQS